MLSSRPSGSLILAASLTIGVSALASQQEPRDYPPPDVTTPILAAMTEVQKYHSKVWSEELGGGPRILDRGLSIGRTTLVTGTMGRPATLAESLAIAKCSTDATLIGSVTGAESFPTANGSFLFTDYQVRVTEIVRALREAGEVLRGQQVIVTRPGGTMTVRGITSDAYDDQFPLLKADGSYVLFLRYLSETRTFQVKSWDYEIRGKEVGLAIGGTTSRPIELKRFFDTLRKAECKQG